MARAGYFPKDELMTFRKFGSRLQGHPDRNVLPGIEANTGSLGQGLSVALGMALASRLVGAGWFAWAMLGDGETQAGQVWEAAMSAGHHRVDTLKAILDYNQVQQTGLVRETIDLEPLADKWRAFRWHVVECDGHDHGATMAALEEAKAHTGSPAIVIAHTIKGKGVSWMELNYNWHGKAPSAEEGERAVAEILGSAG
jgi:transketolase